MTENNGHDNGSNGRDNRGRFAQGNAGKPKGSSKNRMRDQVKDFLNNNWPSFQQWFDELKPKERIDVMLDLMPYSLSRLQSISMTDSDGNDLKPEATIDYTKLSDVTLREILAATSIDNGSENA